MVESTIGTPPSSNPDQDLPVQEPEKCILSETRKDEKSMNGTDSNISGTTTTNVTADNDEEGDTRACSLQFKWSRFMDSMRNGITWAVVTLAQHAARNPKRCVYGTVLLTIALLVIGFVTNFHYHTETDEQMTAFWSRIRGQKYWIEKDSGFPPRPYSLQVIVHAQGANILTQDGIFRMMQAVDSVITTPSYEAICNENTTDISTAKGLSSICTIRGITLFWNNSLTVLEEMIQSDVDVILTANQDQFPDGSQVFVGEIMGRTTTHYDTVTKAESFSMNIQIPNTDYETDSSGGGPKGAAVDVLISLLDLREMWLDEEDITEKQQQPLQYHLEVMMADYSLEQEMIRAAFKDVPLVPIVFVIMTIFTCVVFSTSRKLGKSTINSIEEKNEFQYQEEEHDQDRRQQRILLGMGTVATVALSLGSSYGLVWIIGVPFTSIAQILPFVMFGIGLDDSFVIFQEYIRHGMEKDVVERMGDIFEEVGLSIFLTTLTTAIAFALSMFSNFPMLVWCAAYAFPAVLIDFFYQITFFVALVVLDERRITEKRERRLKQQAQSQEEEGKEHEGTSLTDKHAKESIHDYPPISIVESMTIDLSLQKMQDSSQEQPQEVEQHDERLELESKRGQDREKELSPEERRAHIQHHIHEPNPKPASIVDQFMRWYAKRLLRPLSKAFVIFGFAGLSAGLLYSASQFRQSFDVIQLLPSDSYLKDFLQSLDTYGEGKGWLLPTAYFRDVDQSDPEVQHQMEDYVNELVADMDSISSQPPFFWLRHFQEFLTYDSRLLDLNFNQQMDIFLSVDAFRLLHGDNIVRDPETGNITASRCMLYMDNVDYSSVHEQIQIYIDQNEITKSQPINEERQNSSENRQSFFLYDGTFYAWEFYAFFVDELTFTIFAGVVSVCFIGFFFMPHWSALLFLVPIVSVQCVDLIGFLHICGITLNGMSYYCIVMSIGLLVDFNMHVLLRYYESPLPTRESKVKDSLETIGSSVLIGGLSTFLGVVPMVFSSSDLMSVLFYAFWGMVLIGCSHGLILLPVLLSMVGPETTMQRQVVLMTSRASSVDGGQDVLPADDGEAGKAVSVEDSPNSLLVDKESIDDICTGVYKVSLTPAKPVPIPVELDG